MGGVIKAAPKATRLIVLAGDLGAFPALDTAVSIF